MGVVELPSSTSMLGGVVGEGDRVPPVDARWNPHTALDIDKTKEEDRIGGTLRMKQIGAKSVANVDQMDHGDGFGLDIWEGLSQLETQTTNNYKK
jgi:hypothetical protein